MLFFDLRGFSRASENIEQQSMGSSLSVTGAEISQHIAAYCHILELVMGGVARYVFDEDGVIISHQGNAARTCWGVPTKQQDHQAAAIRSARRIIEALYELDVPFALDVGRDVDLRRDGQGCGSSGAARGDDEIRTRARSCFLPTGG